MLQRFIELLRVLLSAVQELGEQQTRNNFINVKYLPLKKCIRSMKKPRQKNVSASFTLTLHRCGAASSFFPTIRSFSSSPAVHCRMLHWGRMRTQSIFSLSSRSAHCHASSLVSRQVEQLRRWRTGQRQSRADTAALVRRPCSQLVKVGSWKF